MRKEPPIGEYIECVLEVHDIPRKAISARTRIHESTLSRKINGAQDFQQREIFKIGFAAGKYVGETQTQPKTA